ncbi:hypothetical protein CMUS01_05999 [Colletotrichum musicola]|uniref:Uncharacterized protein n=2 Tax=Colletotrichum orchidearum species complex TaxID=2707337 RepID=A0A8H6KPV0_9PEZI|nr:hypothetical protein CPLU01_12205 [Colletotrichum plurivorum]KAF6834878.1 hypothetical protein CMUS01_05999 [Colletotrichum musicola]
MSHRRVSAGGRVVADSTARQNWGRRIDLVVAIAGPGTPPRAKAKHADAPIDHRCRHYRGLCTRHGR